MSSPNNPILQTSSNLCFHSKRGLPLDNDDDEPFSESDDMRKLPDEVGLQPNTEMSSADGGHMKLEEGTQMPGAAQKRRGPSVEVLVRGTTKLPR